MKIDRSEKWWMDKARQESPDPDMPDLSLCSFEYLAAELRRRGATVTPAPHGGDFAPVSRS